MDRRDFLGVIAVAAIPSGAYAQPARKVYRIGFLGAASAAAPASKRRVEAFRDGLRKLGYVEGANLVIDFRWAEDDVERLLRLARELLGLGPDVLVSQGSRATRAAKTATSKLPIVMLAVGDAVGAGLVASLAHPGGNITGSSFLAPQIYAKQLELLREAAPHITRVAVLLNPDNPANRAVLQSMDVATRPLKVTVTPIEARSPAGFDQAFGAMARQRLDAIVVSADPMLTANGAAIAQRALAQRLPSASARDYAEAGGLLGYGANIVDLYARAPRFVDRILKGAKPGDLPVEQPTHFELVLNLKTAKALGITFGQALRQRADEVIE
jgi:putative tryptophan/tyrosine transport system substrate-binding protein